MKIMLDGEEIELTKIKQSEFYEVLSDKVNILLFGKSGWGKTQTVKKYCLDNGLKLKLIPLASWLPEMTGGVPHCTEKGYYELLLWEELKDVLEDDEKQKMIAEAGYRKTLQKHTWSKRTEELLEFLETLG